MLRSNGFFGSIAFKLFGLGAMLFCLCLSCCIISTGTIVITIAHANYGTNAVENPTTTIEGGENAVTEMAKAMAAQLLDCRTLNTPNAMENHCTGKYPRYAALTGSFPTMVLAWGRKLCGSDCWSWENGSFQCVSFVLGAYSQFHALDYSGNGDQFWFLYSSQAAHNQGYQTVATGKGLPITPGDIMAWSGGANGHVSIVLGWIAPKHGKNGIIVFAGANTWKPIEALPIKPDLTIDTSGYWGGYHVQGYIHPSWLPIVPANSPGEVPNVTADNLPKSPYVALARDAALTAGIDVNVFLRQINQESGFDPTKVSSAGALGIAQLLPSTAKSLGVDPSDPVASLTAAATLMAQYLQQFGGNYAKALAAYNAGTTAVANAVKSCWSDWLTCLPSETQDYIKKILNE